MTDIWKFVPVTLTAEMFERGSAFCDEAGIREISDSDIEDLWKVEVAAAPQCEALEKVWEALKEQTKYVTTFLQRDGCKQDTIDDYTANAREALAALDEMMEETE